jgi:hypothetical protein
VASAWGQAFGSAFGNSWGLIVSEDVARARPSDNEKKRRTIFKPTGLVLARGRKTIQERLQETALIHREVIEGRVLEEIQEPPPIEQMTLREIEAEIGERLRAQLRKDDEEIVMLLLMAAHAS